MRTKRADHRYALILAGGRGTRFWPRSRRSRAKQVLKFFGERSLIQQTVDRLKPVLPPERVWVLTNDFLRKEIVSQLPEVPKEQILAEPVQRNTAPAIGLAARILQSIDPDSVMGVFPADQLIAGEKKYIRLLEPAFRAAEDGKIAVMGIQPRWAETGFGYIEFPQTVEPGAARVFPVLRFREKPDAKTARKFVAAGRFFWNAGMFFWRSNVLLDELGRHLPQTGRLLHSLPEFGSRRFAQAVRETFPKCENISIDYAVLEKATNVVGVPAGDIGWSDVGSWSAVHELHPRDASGNAARAEALFHDAAGNYVDSQGKMVVLLGVRDLIVVETPDALLVAGRSRAQEVGDIVKLLEQRGRHDLL